MCSRAADLAHVLKSEGLTDADKEAAQGFGTAHAAGLYADLLRGKLAEAGGVLGSKAAHVHRGLAAGRELLPALLSQHTQREGFAAAVLTPAESAAFEDRAALPSMTCTRLLNLVGRVKKEVRARQVAAALASHHRQTAEARTVRHQPTGPPNQDAEHDAYQPQDAAEADYYAKK